MNRFFLKRSAWTRVWTSNVANTLEEGLSMRMADAAWVLGRQYQMGALTGDDAASPVRVEITRRENDVNQFKPTVGSRWHAIDEDVPLEVQTEAQSPQDLSARYMMLARLGLQFFRLFPEIPRKDARTKAQTYAKFTARQIAAVSEYPDVSTLMKGSVNAVLLRRHRVAVAAEYVAIEGGNVLTSAVVTSRLEAWLAQYNSVVTVPKAAATWRDEELSYGIDVRARPGAAQNRIELRATDHDGGRLDWFSFKVGAASPGLTKNVGRLKTDRAYPTPIRYAGMPAETLWDFEDGGVYFGGLKADKTDLAQLVLTEFATVYSNDWFMVPLRAKTGTLQRISKITVHDTYGDKFDIKSTAENDGAKRPNRFFEITGDTSADSDTGAKTPWLYLPRVTGDIRESRVLEQVSFVRDESANLAWGIESHIGLIDGRTRDRTQHWARVRDNYDSYNGISEMPEPDADATAWTYRLLTKSTPPHWVPFVPEIDGDFPTGRLRRARLQDWDLLGESKEEIAGPQGRLMAAERPLLVQNAQIPPGGTQVARVFQSTRDVKGKLHVWIAYRRRPAKQIESAGRLTDVVERGRKS